MRKARDWVGKALRHGGTEGRDRAFGRCGGSVSPLPAKRGFTEGEGSAFGRCGGGVLPVRKTPDAYAGRFLLLGGGGLAGMHRLFRAADFSACPSKRWVTPL